jgi:hypothetical protein
MVNPHVEEEDENDDDDDEDRKDENYIKQDKQIENKK